jgi:opacity protein-like surface antigen
MKKIFLLALSALAVAASASAQDADESQMMMHCNTYAAKHLNMTESQIAPLNYQGHTNDGTQTVSGNTTTGITFQCTFGPHGHKVVSWWHSAPADCPADVSEANRYLYPGCE